MFVTLKVKLVAPDDGAATATDGEIREALESAIADIAGFDVDVEEHEDGVEVWTVDEVNVTSIER